MGSSFGELQVVVLPISLFIAIPGQWSCNHPALIELGGVSEFGRLRHCVPNL